MAWSSTDRYNPSLLRGLQLFLLAIVLAAVSFLSFVHPTGAAAEDVLVADSINNAGSRTCAVRPSGELLCWGRNRDGQLGDGSLDPNDGSYQPRLLPTVVPGITDVEEIATGPFHSCALRETGQVLCWGRNDDGQLGDGSTTRRLVPTPVSGLTDAKAISAGGAHTCAVRSSGQAVCWGANPEGQLGIGTTQSSPVPVSVQSLANAESITAGGDHTCAIRTGGQAVCWGYNVDGQIGDGSRDLRFDFDDPADSPYQPRLSPVSVQNLTNAASIDAGGDHTCAVRTTGQALCWGLNQQGRLGDGTTTDRYTPTNVKDLTDATVIAAGSSHTCAVRSGGQALCWGFNGNGKLGNGTKDNHTSPVPVQGLGDASTIVANDGNSCALRQTGQAVCWGFNGAGQIGNGTTTESWVPASVVDPNPPAPVGLSVALQGDGEGKVTSSPAGIDCGNNCSISFPAGTDVTLRAVAADGSSFSEWTGCDTVSTEGDCRVKMAAQATVTATFTKQTTPPPPPPNPGRVGSIVVPKKSSVKAGRTKALTVKVRNVGGEALTTTLRVKSSNRNAGLPKKTTRVIKLVIPAGKTRTMKVKAKATKKARLSSRITFTAGGKKAVTVLKIKK